MILFVIMLFKIVGRNLFLCFLICGVGGGVVLVFFMIGDFLILVVGLFLMILVFLMMFWGFFRIFGLFIEVLIFFGMLGCFVLFCSFLLGLFLFDIVEFLNYLN